jgi:hypothetical protein
VQNLSIETMSMFYSLNNKKTYNYPLKQRNQPAVEQKLSLEDYRKMIKKDEPLEELDWDDEPKEEVKTSEETKLPTKEKPKFNLQGWKDDDEQIIKISTKLVDPTLEQKETLVNFENEDLENMFEEVEIKEKPKSKPKDK